MTAVEGDIKVEVQDQFRIFPRFPGELVAAAAQGVPEQERTLRGIYQLRHAAPWIGRGLEYGMARGIGAAIIHYFHGVPAELPYCSIGAFTKDGRNLDAIYAFETVRRAEKRKKPAGKRPAGLSGRRGNQNAASA